MLPGKIGVRVEALSDARWTRIERDLFTKLQQPHVVSPVAPARRPSVAWAAALAAGIALLFGAVARPWGPYRSELRMRLATTDATSQFTVGESSLSVAAHSLLMVDGDDERGIDVVLDRGSVTCEVAPRRGRPPFLLDAGEVRVRVVGTRFTVTHHEAETAVDVDHGTVEVFAGGVRAVLHDGDHWPARPVATAPPVRDSGPPRAASLPPGGELPAPTPPAPSRSPHKHAAVASGHADTSGHADSEPDETPAPEASDGPPPAPAGPPSQEVFEDAARLERTSPAEAAAAYRRLAAGDGAWAPTALFALARLQIDRGDRAEGVRLLRTYLAKYPGGINAEDARELLRRAR